MEAYLDVTGNTRRPLQGEHLLTTGENDLIWFNHTALLI